MKPDTTETSYPVSAANSPARAFYTSHPAGPVQVLPAPPVPTGATSWGHRGNASGYGSIDRAAEAWTARELSECLRRNLD